MTLVSQQSKWQATEKKFVPKQIHETVTQFDQKTFLFNLNKYKTWLDIPLYCNDVWKRTQFFRHVSYNNWGIKFQRSLVIYRLFSSKLDLFILIWFIELSIIYRVIYNLSGYLWFTDLSIIYRVIYNLLERNQIRFNFELAKTWAQR